jgi:hypothetical protein
MKTIEDWAALKETPDWLFAAAKMRHKWGEGRELTEADYTKAIEDVGSIQLSGYPNQQRADEELKRRASEEKAQRDARAREVELAPTHEEQLATQAAAVATKEG